jgi:hypothetical protein
MPASVALALLVPWSHAHPQPKEAGACPAADARVTEGYRWYPTLDLARIPFHTASGPWGPRAPIIAPEAPETRRTARVTSATQLAAEALIPGTRILIDADYIGPAVIFGDVTDVDIVVPRGRTLAKLIIGRYTPPSATRRVRIRGTTPGVHSGGVVGQINFASNPATDLIIDGLDLNGDDGQGGGILLHFVWPPERVAVVNNRGHGVGSASIMGDGNDIVFAGNRILSGVRSREINGYLDGWGLRGGSRIVVYDNRIEGTRYHRVRVHPGAKRPQYAWVANNIFVDPNEARIFGAWRTDNSQHRFSGVWAVCNRIYAHSTCMSASFEAQDVDYAMLTSNSFFGSFTAESQRALQALHGPGRDYVSGNTFSRWQPPPPWQTGENPAAVPLPPVNGSRYNAGLASKPCPPP